jgi:transcriptional regulator GlxA family with amidase domain
LADLAGIAGLSRTHFARQFRVATGFRPHDYLLRKRIERAQQMLAATSDALVDIAFSVGFQTQAHFSTVFKNIVGDTPRQWRREQSNVP